MQSGYHLAQRAFADLKEAVRQVLAEEPEGLRNADLARRLGLNFRFLGDNEGWITHTVLKAMELDETVEQVRERGPWRLKSRGS